MSIKNDYKIVTFFDRKSKPNTDLEIKFETFVNRIYGKQRRRKIMLCGDETKDIQESHKNVIEKAIFKKMDDVYRNERLSQRETRIQEALYETEVLQAARD